MRLTELANPSRFNALAERVLPWLVVATVLAFALGSGGGLLRRERPGLHGNHGQQYTPQ